MVGFYWKFNESKNSINWGELSDKWDDFVEMNNNEFDYDDGFSFMKSLVVGDFDWSTIRSEYYDYIEMTNDEDDHDRKFYKFMNIVKKNS